MLKSRRRAGEVRAYPSRTSNIERRRALYHRLRALEDTLTEPRYDSIDGHPGRFRAVMDPPERALQRPRKWPQMCSVQYEGKRIWVGAFMGGRGKSFPIQAILKRISDFNLEHETSLSLIRPQVARRVVDPASMFQDSRDRNGKAHLLNSCGFPTQYPFEPGIIPTNTMFAYPPIRQKKMPPIVRVRDDKLLFVFNASRYATVKAALLAPGITSESLEIRDKMITFTAKEDNLLLPLPHLLEKGMISARAFDSRVHAGRALSAIGCSLFSLNGMEFLRHDSGFAGFLAMMGNPEDNSAPKRRYFTCSPFEKFSVVLVEVPPKDINTFREHAPSSAGEPNPHALRSVPHIRAKMGAL